MSAGDQLGGALGAGVTRVGLSDRLEEADLQAGALKGAHQAQADGGQADTEISRRNEKCLHACFSK